ncbi:Detected protein of unknown function [Hibiscus syriacus]|uniref:F-box domain-containing protein n=1 Tax=Hibiscus syriacus TaxID=106335 RepID=A0A6A2Y410_HIBSY|nr:Detected protein of unknown function [Hibiscus syriacus]
MVTRGNSGIFKPKMPFTSVVKVAEIPYNLNIMEPQSVPANLKNNNWKKTVSLVIKPTTIRIILTLVVSKGWGVRQLDINNAFFNALLAEDVYMVQPERFVDPEKPDFVCKLDKTIYAVNKLSQFLQQPTMVHWHAIKRVIRYLSGYYVYFGDTLISWSSRKHVARSSTESEYRSLANLATEMSWISSLLEEISFPLPSKPIVWVDNLSAAALASNSNPVLPEIICMDDKYFRDLNMADNDSSSAEMVESNQDLLTQILLYFPVKSLLKSKCVSKRWLSIISDPEFAANNTRLHVNIGPSGLYFYGSPFGFLDFDTNETCSSSQCSNNNTNGSSGFTYCVCNPTTKNFVIVPLPNATANRSIAGINLAFDPSKSSRYKVICVLMNNMQYSDPNEIEHIVSPTYQIEIFSSETKAWTLSGPPFDAPHYTDFEHGVFCNGASIGLVQQMFPFTLTSSPKGWKQWQCREFGRADRPVFGAPRGFLISDNVADYHVNLHVVASEFPEIARRYMDEFPNLAMNNPEDFRVQYYAYSILSVVRGEREDDVEVVMLIPGKIISHNPRRSTTRLLSSWRANNVYDCMQYKWYHVCPYVESLAAP